MRYAIALIAALAACSEPSPAGSGTAARVVSLHDVTTELVVALGVFPGPVLHLTEAPVQRIIEVVNGAGGLTGLSLPW